MEFLHPEYYSNDKINKHIEDIWRDIEGYSSEIFPDDSFERKEKYSFVDILLPIIKKPDKSIIKGLIVSRATDYICSILPIIKNNFILIANSMWGSCSKSENADAYFTLYENSQREEWLRNEYSILKDKLLIPLQDADYANERVLFPLETEKDIDVLMIGRMHRCKNLDIFLKALMYINQKYGKILNAVLITGSGTRGEKETEVYRQLVDICGSEEKFRSYITIVDKVKPSMMFKYYSRAKLTALTSIFEGKNRSIQESLLCNTPVICFSSFNKYIRGGAPILPERCGYYVEEFSAEAFGEKLYALIESGCIKYNTREIALKYYGRANTIERILKTIPYYCEMIPNLFESDILDNECLNTALADKFGSYEDFLYENSITSPLNDRNNYQFLECSNML